MQNSTQTDNIISDPRFLMLYKLKRQCYSENISHSRILEDNYNEGGPWCPRKFDGWTCWDEAPASTTSYQYCPRFIVGFDPRRFAYRRCMENGTWFRHPEFNKSWTNYTTCVDMEDLDFRTNVTNIYVAGYSVSMAALLLSIMIFIYFRSLQCIRIRIHTHLFSAFTLNNILWIVWYRMVVEQVDVVQDNKGWCQFLHIITHYFMVTSYIWMFCESLHLHIALVVVFVKDEVAMRWFVALGWGLSMIVVLVYALVRYYGSGDTKRCWMDQSDTFWIITIPVGVSLLASFVFLVNVIRVLVTKLHPASNQPLSQATKKAARAALILIPLFGLHFIIIPLRPLHGSPGEKLYQIVSALITSLQGLCVAVLFCFTNHDVRIAIRNHMSRYWRRNEAIAMTALDVDQLMDKINGARSVLTVAGAIAIDQGVTGGDSLMNTRDNIV